MGIKINTRDIAKKLSTFRKLKPRLSAFKNLQPTTYHLKPNLGFTLIELLVTLSLFVILSGIVLFSQQKFNGSILLTNLAYDVALTIRQAQTFGINVRETSSGDFQKAYGVHFNKNKNTEFILFADTVSGNKKYNGSSNCKSGADECVDKYRIKRGNKISNICAGTSSSCSDVGALDIAFIRPDPDAIINDNPANTEAKITISSADGATRTIVVNSTGQISIQR